MIDQSEHTCKPSPPMGTSSLGGGLGQVLRSPHVQIESNPVPVTPSTMVLLRIDASSKKQNKHNRRCHDEQMISDSNEDSNTHRPSTLPTVPWGALDVLGRSVWEKSHSKEDPTAIWKQCEQLSGFGGDGYNLKTSLSFTSQQSSWTRSARKAPGPFTATISQMG